MKLRYKIGLFLISLLMASTLYGQRKTVEYLLHTHYIHAVPEGTDMNKLAEIDIATLKLPESKEYFELIIDDNNKLKTVINNMQEPESYYDIHNSIKQTEIDEYGITFHDYYGEITFTPYEEERENLELNEEIIKYWGTATNLFNGNMEELAKQFIMEDWQTVFAGSQLAVFKDTIEFLFDFETLYVGTLIFDKAGTLQYVHGKFFERIKDKEEFIIPLAEEIVTYDEFPHSGIRYQKTEIKDYVTYMIREGKEVIVNVKRETDETPEKGIEVYQFSEMETIDFNLKVYPNPASTQITLEFLSSTDDPVDIEIFNIAGASVLNSKGVTGNTATFDIAGLNTGVYIVHCRQNEVTKAVKFIKQ